MIIGKILLGLGQVVSRQPEATKTDFPGPQWDAAFLKLFFMDFAWVGKPNARREQVVSFVNRPLQP